MITIYSSFVSNRLIYVLDFIFNEILDIKYYLTDNKQNLNGDIINYSDEKLELKNYQISPSSLLIGNGFEKPIGKFQNDVFCFFDNSNDDHGFDIFSAVFYLISRMEEYNLSKVDIHGRFISNDSILVQNGVEQKPIVDLWVYDLMDKLNQKFKTNISSKRLFSQNCSFDIDNAFAFKHKGLIRYLASLLKDVVKFKKNKLSQRFQMLQGKSNDPYDTYNYIFDYCTKNKLNQIYFFLLGNYGKNDKNISYKHLALKTLIQNISKYAKVGIHPSYNSFHKKEKIKVEMDRLKGIIKAKVNSSRFHYLRFTFPFSYQNLLDSGIKEDYSMGYSDRIGFRAGTCTPFYFYDLENEILSDLKIIPFAYMDGALKDRQNLSIDQAIIDIQKIKKEVQGINGQFTAVWHNESLSDKDRWIGWRRVFESTWE